MGIKDPTLGTLPPIHKEQNFVSYALEISKGRNIKKLPSLGVKSVQNYLRSETSHAINNGQRDPRLQYTPSGLPRYSSKPLPMLKKLLSHISKWLDRRDEAVPLTTAILRALESFSYPGGPSSEEACIFDAIFLVLHTGY